MFVEQEAPTAAELIALHKSDGWIDWYALRKAEQDEEDRKAQEAYELKVREEIRRHNKHMELLAQRRDTAISYNENQLKRRVEALTSFAIGYFRSHGRFKGRYF